MLGSGGSGWRWSGMVSLTPKWGLPAGEHCCFCTPHAASAFQTHLSSSFHMKIYFQGEKTHASVEFNMKNLFALLWGGTHCFRFVLGFSKRKHLWDWGKCQIVHDPSVPWPPAVCFSQFRLWMSLSFQSRALLLVFPDWSHEQRGENIPSALTWHLPFWVRVCPFSSQNPTNFVTWHLPWLGSGGEVGKPWWSARSLKLCLLQVWI